MKSRCVIMLLVVMLLGASTMMAWGQSHPIIRVKVPFGFRVGQQVMPAGQYQVAHFNTRDMLLIQNLDNDKVMLLPSVPSGKHSDFPAKLVFHRYGETYFLRQVWIPPFNANELFQTKTEKEYASRWGEAVQTAVVGTTNNSANK